MPRYHINPETGNPGICRAHLNCPFGDLETEHYESRKAAQNAFEQAMQDRALGVVRQNNGTFTFPDTYEFPSWRLPEAIRSVERANRRAAKAGINEKFEYVTHTFDNTDVDQDGFETFEERVRFVLNRPTLKHEDWTFAGTMSWDEEVGLITRMAPGEKLIDKPRAKVCDVCNTTRHRVDTYIVQKDNEQKQVGSNCLRRFMGIKPASLWMLDFEPVLKEYDPDTLKNVGPKWADERRNTVSMLGLGLAISETYGWTSKGAATAGRLSTMERVEDIFSVRNRKKVEQEEKVRLIARGKELEKDAETVLAFAQKINVDSDYAENLKKVTSGETVSMRNLPLALSAIGHAQRLKKKEEDTKVKKASQWVGEEGESLVFTKVTVADVKLIENNYGFQKSTSKLVTFSDKDGNQFKTFYSGAGNPKKGQDYQIPASRVKKHQEWQGAKETLLTRVKFEKIKPTVKPPTKLPSSSPYSESWTTDENAKLNTKEHARIKKDIKKKAGVGGWDNAFDRPTDVKLQTEFKNLVEENYEQFTLRYNELNKEEAQ